MIIQCCKCRVFLGHKEPLNNLSITHSLCDKCSKEYHKKMDIDELMKRLDEPPKPKS